MHRSPSPPSFPCGTLIFFASRCMLQSTMRGTPAFRPGVATAADRFLVSLRYMWVVEGCCGGRFGILGGSNDPARLKHLPVGDRVSAERVRSVHSGCGFSRS